MTEIHDDTEHDTDAVGTAIHISLEIGDDAISCDVGIPDTDPADIAEGLARCVRGISAMSTGELCTELMRRVS